MVFTFTDHNIMNLKTMDGDYNKNIPNTSGSALQNNLIDSQNEKLKKGNLDSTLTHVCTDSDENTSIKRVNDSGRQYCSHGWLKYVMVGKQYQADIPECLQTTQINGESSSIGEISNDTKDILLWNPSGITETTLTKYLSNSSGNSPPKGSHIKDNETALYSLMKCKNNVRKATRMRVCPQPLFPTSKTWTGQECTSFEDGWIRYGKDFLKIHKLFLPARSVSEIVHFYYFWKKSARRDMLNSRTRRQKKKFEINPGCIDLMEKFLDEEFIDHFRSRSPSCSEPVIL